MLTTIVRLVAFVRGDASAAEGFVKPDKGETPSWIKQAAADDDASKLALELALKSLELADSAVESLQSKASTHLTLTLALVPFALGLTALASPPDETPPIQTWLPVVALVAADLCLAIAIAFTALASGLTQSGGISLTRLGELALRLNPADPASSSALRSAATEAIRVATLYAYASGSRIAQDLFYARRWTLLAVLLSLIGIVGVVVVSGASVLLPLTQT